ncbi:Outer membrane protein [Salinivirga cyanobacteriivorans]|uniref:Outer membrane protein n=1 Tax=Salinivirga cyanobacteriivorans TaxID=1307839 RepID=A0A0S2HVQ4_9BACT|nr:TonB-dependent receptor [Salinivirga cyanobacteriivorans]ALO14090.1 Outer membrane protein [Salinivirga cyanobacteriivorans]
MNIKFFLTVALLFYCLQFLGQNNKFIVSGNLKSSEDGEDLPFATVSVKELPGVGAITNNYGFYSLTLPKGNYTLTYQFVGYETFLKQVNLESNKNINVELNPIAKSIDEIVISARKANENVTRNDGSISKIDAREIKDLPTFGGEVDIIKVLQTQPGVKTAGEGGSGFYVRGGGLDQNLVLLDETPVYNPSHLMGFFSVFNGDAIKGATLYKGGMAPEYGGRTSSVLDIRMKDGNAKNLSVSGGIGTIASRLTIEGPMVKDKGSFMVSGRRTYADLFLKLSKDESLNKSILYFYDLNLKANYRISDKDRIFLSGYFGRDEFGFDDVMGLNYGNATGTLRWNHVFSNKLFSNASIVYSDYDYEFGFGEDDDRLALQSVIKDINFKYDFSLFASAKHTLKFGVNSIYHTIEPGNLSAGSNTGLNSSNSEEKYGLESAIYIQDDFKLNGRFSLSYGLRYSFFQQIGSGTEYQFNSDGQYLGEKYYGSGKLMKNYGGFEPRLSATYILDEYSSLKLGYNRNYQYMHMLTNSTTSSPTDTWIMSTNNIKPQIADQVSLGYFRNFRSNMFETSIEAYYKDMQRVIDYRTGANVFLNDLLEGDLVFGDGRAYGVEFLIKKNEGRLTGWLGYTLSRSEKQFDEINNGEWFAARQDRIHDINLVAMYDLNEKITLSANFIYYTGDAVTFPSGRYVVDGKVVPYYTDRNSYRMPDYHRLDLGLTWHTKKTKKFSSSWNFSLYNAYGRENAYSISFEPKEDDPNQTQAVQLSLFKWVPSITYNFKF